MSGTELDGALHSQRQCVLWSMGMAAWSQIATGTYYGNQLMSKGLATKKMQRGAPFGKDRAYFYITDAGRAALQQTPGSMT